LLFFDRHWRFSIEFKQTAENFRVSVFLKIGILATPCTFWTKFFPTRFADDSSTAKNLVEATAPCSPRSETTAYIRSNLEAKLNVENFNVLQTEKYFQS